MTDPTVETIEAIRAAAILFGDWVAAGDLDRAESYAVLFFTLAAMIPEPEEAR